MLSQSQFECQYFDKLNRTIKLSTFAKIRLTKVLASPLSLFNYILLKD